MGKKHPFTVVDLYAVLRNFDSLVLGPTGLGFGGESVCLTLCSIITGRGKVPPERPLHPSRDLRTNLRRMFLVASADFNAPKSSYPGLNFQSDRKRRQGPAEPAPAVRIQSALAMLPQWTLIGIDRNGATVSFE